MDMAVGLIIGGAFGAVVKSTVDGPIGPMLGIMDFADLFLVIRHGLEPGPCATFLAAQ